MSQVGDLILIVYVSFFTLQFILERLLTALNLKYVHDHGERPPQPLSGYLDTESYRKSVNYTLKSGKFGLLAASVSSLFLLFMVLSGGLGKIEFLFRLLRVGSYIRGILYIYSISALFSLVSLPFSLYSQFVIEQRFGFNRMTIRLFLLDLLKGLLISVLLITPLLYALFALMDTAGKYWWIWAFSLITIFQLVLTILYPTLIAPLFNKFTRLEEGPLRERIKGLAESLNFKTRGIFVMDGSKRSRHSNAYFTGLGKVKRIVLFDTLIQALKDEQVAAVLAHEIGHEKRRHVLKRMLVSIAGTFVGLGLLSLVLDFQPFFKAFGFSSSSYQAAIVIFGYCSGPFIFLLKPLFSAWSRRQEYEADRFAVKAVKGPEALSGALLALSRDNLSNLTPHPWYSFYYYTHPALLERIRALDPKI